MVKSSSDFVFDDEVYLSELLDGDEEGGLQQLDARLAELLQLQDAIFLSVTENMRSSGPARNTRATSTKPKFHPRKSATKAGESSRSYCKICVERKERRQMFPISGCSHSFCSDCICKHVKTRIDDHITVIMFPGENCRVILELEACRPLLPKEVIGVWEDLLREEVLCATGGRLYCPFKDCRALLLNDIQGEVIKDTECPFCHRLFCAQCRVPWHSDINCEKYQKLNQDERGIEDIMMRNLAKEKKWPSCPSCHMTVEKTEGCPHMTCRCGAEWTADHGGCQGN